MGAKELLPVTSSKPFESSTAPEITSQNGIHPEKVSFVVSDMPLSPVPPEFGEPATVYEMFPDHFAKDPYKTPPPFWVEQVRAGITTLLDPRCNTPSKRAHVLYAFLDFAEYDPAGVYAISRVGALLETYQGDESRKESIERY